MTPSSRETSSPAPLAIIGPYPPPSGGVTVHVERLCRLLDVRGVDYRLYNVSSATGDGERVVPVSRGRRRFLLRHALFGPEPAVYVVSPRIAAWLYGAAVARARGKRVAIRIQNNRLVDWHRRRDPRAALAGAALRQVAAVVCVNQGIADTVRALGVSPERISLLPGFLPPEPAADEPLHPGLEAFLRDRRPVLAANGKVAFYDGADLYGLDLLVELAAALRPDHPGLGIAICLYELDDEGRAHLERLRGRAETLGVTRNILFHAEPGPFVPVLGRADVFLRPTNTDGDANSLREALFLGVPSVASDAVPRPPGAILFRSRDAGDLVHQVRAALVAPRDASGRGGLTDEDGRRIEEHLDLLRRLGEGGG